LVGQILIKLSLAMGISSGQRCQLSNENSAYSGTQEACIPKQIAASSYICKVGIMDNKKEAFPLSPTLLPLFLSLSFS